MSDRTPPPGIEEVYGRLSAPGESLGLATVNRAPPPGADDLFGSIAPPKPKADAEPSRGLLATVTDAARGLLSRQSAAAPEGSNVGNFRVPASIPTQQRPAGELLTQPNPDAQQPEQPAPLSREMAGRLKATLAAMKPEDRALAEQIPGWRGVAAQVLNRQIAAESQGAQRLEMPGASLESRTAYGVGQGMDAQTATSKAGAELAAGLPGGPTAQLTAGRPSVLTPEEEAAARADGQGMQKRSTAARGFYGAQEGLAQGAAGVIAAALQAAGDKEGAAIYEKVGKAASVRAESANELKALQAKAAESGITPSGPLTGAANYVEGMSTGAANSIGQMIPGIAVGLATGSGPAALAVMALPVFGQSYVEKRDAGGAPGASAAYAGLMAGFEVLGERYGVLPAALNAFKAKAKDVPLDELPKFLERGIVAMEKRGLLNKTAAGLARTQAGEQFGEQLTSAGQYLLDGTALGLDKPVSVTGFLTNARDTAVQTLIATGVMQAGGVAAKKLTGAEGAQAAPAAAPAPAAPLAPVDLTSTKLSGAEVPVSETSQEKPQAAPAAVEAVANIEKLLGTPLDADAHEAATSPLNDRPEPTQAQKDAGNYKVGHIRVQGMDVSIENPRGSVRRGTSPDGTAWENTLAHHYGYLKGTKAIDGDQVDVFIGPNPESARAYVVDQVDQNGKFDEPKALIGFDSIEDAKAGYLANYAPGWTGLGAITELPIDAFKSWAKDGTKRKPLGDINGAKPDAGGPAGLADRPADGGGDQPAGGVEPVGELPAAGGPDGVSIAPEGIAPSGEPAVPVGGGSGADAALSREAVGQQFTALAEEFAASGRATGRTFQRVLAGYADNIADGSIKDAELPALAEKLAQYRRMLGEPEATPPAPPPVEPEVDTPTERAADDVLQLDGKAWTITKASPRAITIKNEAGKVRTIAAGSPTWAKIDDQNQPNAPAEAEAVAPTVEAPAPAAGDAGTAGADPSTRPALAQAARVTKPRKQQSAVRGSPALGAISARLGGIDPSLLADLSSKVERSRVSKLGKKSAYTTWDNPPHAGKGPLFRAGGSKDLSLIAQMLEEEGFIPAGTYEADPVGAGQQAAEIIRAELRQGGGTLRTGSADDVEAEMRRRMEAAMDRFEEHGISPEAVVDSGYLDTTEAAQAALDAAIEALADAESDVVDAFLQSVAEVEAQEERDAIQADSEADAQAGESRGGAARAPEGGAGTRRHGPEETAGGTPATAEGLTSPTPESLAADDRHAKDAAAADAREQKRLADKAKADAERGEFTLTGSDRPADVAAAAGQGDLLETRDDDSENEALFQRAAPSFSESLDKVLDGTLPESAALKVSDSLPVLELLGMRRLPLATTGDRLTKMHFDHGLTRSELKRLPELLASPVAVFESDTQPGSLVAVLDLVKNGAPVVAAIKPSANLKRVEVNLLASAYPKDRAEQLGRWVDAGLLRYVDKRKTRGEATIGGVQFPWMVQLQRGSRGTVLGPQDIDKAAFSRKAGARGADPVRGAAQSYVDRITKDWANAPKVTVIDSMADAPEAVRRANESQMQQGADGEPSAFTYRGEVFIVAGQIKSMEGLAESLFHEALGHLGLRGLFGADLHKVLRQMAASMPDAIKAKAKQYGLDLSKPDERMLAAEELLAEIAETRPSSTWVRKAITAIREWLRKHIPALADLKWSDSEVIEKVIVPARRFIEDGRGQAAETGEPAVAFQRNGATAGQQAAPKRSAWRDATNRVQFAPGQWLYDAIGAAARPLLLKTGMKAASPELRRQIRAMRLEVQKAQETAVAVARETQKLTEDERLMVSDIIEKELAAGTIPPTHAVRLAALMNQTMGAQTGDLVRLGMLTQETAQRWDGAYLPRFYESKLRKQVGDAWADALRRILGRTSAMKGIKGKHLKGRGLFETIAATDLPAYEALGWEVRDPDYTPGSDDQVQVWRDYTRAERDDMGEIRDAGFRFVMGYMQTQRDIALGKMFEGMAGDPAISSRLPKQGWVQVPNTTVEGTGAKRYGKLGGRYVPEEVLSHLSQIEESQSAAWQMYRKAMSIWKEGKTVLNPVSHVNNILSNLTMAHFAGVGYHRADKYVAAIRDFATKSPTIIEAKNAGLFLGTLSDAELMNTLPKELQDLAMQAESKTQRGAKFVYNAMTWFLRKPMGAAYQAEDIFFRYLIYKDARRRGVEPNDAVEYAQKFIFTYDDLPRGARFVRDFGIPFFAYTYKAVPALLHTALTHPVRFAAPAAVLWAANAMAYAIGAGDDDDSWDEILQRYLTDPEFRAKAREAEQLEREHLPPWMKGTTSLQTPKAIRMGMDEVTKLPLFLDVARIVPGGDLFDVSPNAGGLPLPQPITPSHPLFSIGVGMIGNKDLFFGKEIVDSNDTRGEAAVKRSEWLWKQVAPALAVGGGHWERGMNALAQASGGEIEWLPEAISEKYTGIGKDRLPVQPGLAALQTFGIKLRPYDLQKSAEIEGGMRTKMIRDIASEMRSLARLNGAGALSDAVFEREMEKARVKIDRLTEGLTVDGEER